LAWSIFTANTVGRIDAGRSVKRILNVTSFFTELKRRNVFRVGIAYVVIAWLLAQVADLALENFGSPDWVIKTLLFLLALGFPLALFFAWAFELTPEGIKKEKEVDRGESITPKTGRKLDRMIIAVLVVALAYFAYDKVTNVPPQVADEEITQAASSAIDAGDTPPPSAGSAPREKSVAVLPFRNLSVNPEDEFFVEGMHDDLLTQLAKIGSLKVISRTSVGEYKGTTKKIPEIAAELGVATILEGGVQRSGTRIRFNAQLIDAQTDEHLWAETYNRELTAENLFDIQAEIARAITTALQAALSPEEEARINRALTDNLEAWEFYQRAVALTYQQVSTDMGGGISIVDRALELDPDFAAAWSLKAVLMLQQFWFYDPDPAKRTLAMEAIQRGRSLDPTLPEHDLAEGYYHYWGFRDYESALPFMQRASAALPNNSRVHSARAYVLRRTGVWEETLEAMGRSVELDPRRSEHYIDIAETLTSLRRFDEARPVVASALKLKPNLRVADWVSASLMLMSSGDLREFSHLLHLGIPANPDAQLDAWRSSLYLRDFDAALRDVDQWQEIFLESKDFVISRPMLRGLTWQYAGETEKARPLLRASKEEFEQRLQNNEGNFAILRSLCVITGGLGDLAGTREHCSSALATAPKDEFLVSDFKFTIAVGLASAGDAQGAVALLKDVLDHDAGPTIYPVMYHPAFDGIRETLEYIRFFEQYGPE
jgi:TolB-like protein